MSDIDLEQLKKLRAPFPDNQISKLPKETKQQADERKADMSKGVKCQLCGGWHHRNAVHLDYVGHAAATDRLLDVDPLWTWEPLATDAIGLPALDRNGNMWIKLTVCGVTRLGYGAADGKTGGDAIKEQIGDAIRNAGMRFGMALDLWHKGDLHAHVEDDAAPAQSAAYTQSLSRIAGFSDTASLGIWWADQKAGIKGMVSEAEYADIIAAVKTQKTDIESKSNPFDEAA